MAYSENHKYQWWGQPRTASRSMMPIQNKLGFIDTNHHNCIIHNPNWSTIINIRNPYSRMVSFWIMRHQLRNLIQERITFSEFVESENEYYNISGNHLWNPIPKLKKLKGPIYLIRFETISNDLCNIPLIRTNMESLTEELNFISNENPFRQNHLIDLNKPYCEFYSEETANIVYQRKIDEFETWGYEKDSWKTLKF